MAKLIVTCDYQAASIVAADIVQEVIRTNPEAVIAPGVGNSMLGLHSELAARARAGNLDGSRLRIFQLDDYAGISPDDPRSFLSWLERTLLGPLSIEMRQVTKLCRTDVDLDSACRQYREALSEAGGLDLAILGIGMNGHIGFNEPPASNQLVTRTVKLSGETLTSNSEYWGEGNSVPEMAITAGMQELLSARQILLIACGARKREILAKALYGPVSPAVPASYLQHAENVVVVVDQAAFPE